MRSLLRFLLLALMLLVVALVSMLTAMRLAVHGREVAVPDLAGKSPVEARKILEAIGLQIEIERQYYSASVPEGKIISQVPAAGTRLRRGWQIRAAESLGPQRVAIPNLIGQSEHAADINILRRGLEIGAVTRMQMSGSPPGQVLSQAPTANASSVSAPKINLLITDSVQPQAFVMPNFVGQPLGTASKALQDGGFRVGSVTPMAQIANAPTASPAAISPSSVIVSQTPVAGEKIIAGATVNFEVR
jgi:eukaryotic-like serine/threonine-protein kinase